ncbi:MAG: GGDEF domain-containing protein, partial [Leptospiraceae bacterium]|nr:GGDEF domain-containing protein [Leptospiraceae bacterium]
YGHAIGDNVLIKVVEIIQAKIRKLDFLFRIGGEEFIVLLPDTNLEGALVVAEKIRKEIEKASILNDRTVTVSIGVAEI